MGKGSSTAADQRLERKHSILSQAAWVISAGGVLGVLMSVAYYRALGAPRAWQEIHTGAWRFGEQGVGDATAASSRAGGRRVTRNLMQSSGSPLLSQEGEPGTVEKLLVCLQSLLVYHSTEGTHAVGLRTLYSMI